MGGVSKYKYYNEVLYKSIFVLTPPPKNLNNCYIKKNKIKWNICLKKVLRYATVI